MKKFFLINLLLLLVSNISAQEELHKLLHTKGYKHNVNKSVVKLNPDITIPEGVFILKQDYQLYDKENEDFFGSEDSDIFGTVYSVGFFYKRSMIVSDAGYRPWNYDSKFDEYRNKYDGVLYKSYYATVFADNIETFQEINTGEENPIEIAEGKCYAYTHPSVTMKGVAIHESENSMAGSILWVVKEGKTFKTEIAKFTANSTESVELTSVPDNAIGAVFVVKDSIAGIVNNTNGKWTLDFPFAGVLKDLDDMIVND